MLHIPLGAALSGFMMGVALPAVWGVWMLYDLAAQAAAAPPGTGQCGTSALGTFILAWLLIFLGWPVGGAIGAVMGFAGGAIYQIHSSMLQPHPATGRFRKPID